MSLSVLARAENGHTVGREGTLPYSPYEEAMLGFSLHIGHDRKTNRLQRHNTGSEGRDTYEMLRAETHMRCSM